MFFSPSYLLQFHISTLCSLKLISLPFYLLQSHINTLCALELISLPFPRNALRLQSTFSFKAYSIKTVTKIALDLHNVCLIIVVLLLIFDF